MFACQILQKKGNGTTSSTIKYYSQDGNEEWVRCTALCQQCFNEKCFTINFFLSKLKYVGRKCFEFFSFKNGVFVEQKHLFMIGHLF